MASLITTMISIFIFAPILFFICVLFITQFFKNNFRISFQLAADVSTIIFLVAIHFLIETIWGGKWFFLSVAILFLVLLIFGVVKSKNKRRLQVRKIIKNTWRFTFLASFILYFIFLMIGIFSSIITTM